MRQVLGFGLVLLAASAFASAAAPLECPKGTRLESREGGAQQFCVDGVTGLKEGPERQYRPNGSLAGEGINHAGKHDGTARVYGEDGNLMAEMLYDKGELKSMHMTLAGLRMQVEKQNARFKAADQPYHMSVVDEKTLVFDVRVESDSPFSSDEQSRMREQFFNDPAQCRAIAGMGIDVINFRILSPKAVMLGKFALAAADCGAKQPAK